jgi:hypothetical protein
MLRRALKRLLTVIDEGYTDESQADEPRIVKAREALLITGPVSANQEQVAQPPDYPDTRNDCVLALKHLSNLKAILDRIDETFGGDAFTQSEFDDMAASAEFIGDRNADLLRLTLHETLVIDESGDCTTRHFAWTKEEAIAAAVSRADKLIREGHRDPSSVHTREPKEHAVFLTKDGVLRLLNDEFRYLY